MDPLPPFLVNPIPLQYVDDDWHVIAFFSGHPRFECVEAMFSPGADGTFSVRAILTRHDQTQVDFVNDPGLLAGELAAERTRVLRKMEVDVGEHDGLPVVEVRFDSLENESVVLRLACASRPDPSRGGLTDPGAHALGSSLPLMWRAASAVAGAASSVHIAGVRYPMPEVFRQGPHFVAHQGFCTQGFHMAAIRNESRSLRVVRQPRSLRPGEQWVYETPSGELVYEIHAKQEDQTLRIVSSARQGETVYAKATPGGLAWSRIVVPPLRTQGEGASISFDPSGAFTIGVDGHGDVLRGTISAPDAHSLLLAPQTPAWAIARPVRVLWTMQDDIVTLETTCRAA